MNLTITINMDNASFEHDPFAQIKYILDQAMRNIEQEEYGRPLIDINGNSVGEMTLLRRTRVLKGRQR